MPHKFILKILPWQLFTEAIEDCNLPCEIDDILPCDILPKEIIVKKKIVFLRPIDAKHTHLLNNKIRKRENTSSRSIFFDIYRPIASPLRSSPGVPEPNQAGDCGHLELEGEKIVIRDPFGR